MIPDAVRLLIPQYLSGELSSAERESLKTHIDKDASLRREVEDLRMLWQDLGLLDTPQPSPALRAHFYQKLNAAIQDKPKLRSKPWWMRSLVIQLTAACAIFALGLSVGRINHGPKAPTEMAELRTQVEGLRQTVALSLMDKQSASSRLQGISWGSQVDRPDQELLTALLTTLSHDPNINVRLASLDALEKFTGDSSVRKALEQSIPVQQSPLVQIALIDALVHIRDNNAANELKKLSNDEAANAMVRQRAEWGLQKLSFE